MRVWCVGVCLPGGQHRYEVFDEFDPAQRRYDDLRRRAGCKVFLWEM